MTFTDIKIIENCREADLTMEVKSMSNSVNSNQVKMNAYTQEKKLQETKSTLEGIEKARSEKKDVKKAPKEDLNTQVDSMNKMMETKNTGLKFNVHEELDRIYVQVVDKKTEEVVKEIPPEKFLDMISSMLDFMGLLIDERI